MVRPKIETEDFLLSITKNCEALIEQTLTKPQETLEFKLNKAREKAYFNSTINIEGYSMIGFTSLQVHNSIFNITEEKKQIQTLQIS